MSRTLTLLLPHVPTSVQQRLPALETLLARGDRHCDQPPHVQPRLLQLCRIASSSAEGPPLGPLCALGDDLDSREGYWLCAEPVHLVADQDQVYLAGRADQLAITEDEAVALAAECNALFHEDGWQLLTPTPTRWYLHLPQTWLLQTAPPDAAVGCAIRPLLPRGTDGLRLQAALTEIQMLFHASAVNARRTATGQPAINSLWLWGGAVMPALAPLPWQGLHGDEPLLRGIAACAGIAAGTAVAADGCAWLQGTGSSLVLLHGELPQLDTAWFTPLLDALRRGELAQLDIHLTATPYSYRLDRRAARRWWHRRRPLAKLI